MKTLCAAVFGLVMITSCSKANFPEDVEIESGDSVYFRKDKLGVAFKAVKEDSRCPENVECFWEGKVTLLIDVKIEEIVNEVELSSKSSAIDQYPNTATIGPYTFELIDVDPKPKHTPLEFEDYSIQIRIDKQND